MQFFFKSQSVAVNHIFPECLKNGQTQVKILSEFAVRFLKRA